MNSFHDPSSCLGLNFASVCTGSSYHSVCNLDMCVGNPKMAPLVPSKSPRVAEGLSPKGTASLGSAHVVLSWPSSFCNSFSLTKAVGP